MAQQQLDADILLNISEETLKRVRAEVHRSHRMELSPTTPIDVAPGEVVEMILPAPDQTLSSLSAYPEVA